MAALGSIGAADGDGMDNEGVQTDNPMPADLNHLVFYTYDVESFTPVNKTTGIPLN